MKKTKFLPFALIFSVLLLISLVLVFLIPTLINNSTTSTIKQKALPNINNTDLWGKFPGVLNTTLMHSFNFYNYTLADRASVSKEGDILLTNNTVQYVERIDYKDITLNSTSNQINFTAYKTYTKTSSEQNENIRIPSLGMFEALETLSHPPLYQQGINSLHYLKQQTLGIDGVFIKKLFTKYTFDSVMSDKNKVFDIILKNVTESKRELIYTNENYGLGKINTFYKWVLLIGNEQQIENANWLISVLNLTSEEIESLLGKNSWLNENYNSYNEQLAKDFNCADSSYCGNELIYKQLIDGSVLKTFNFNNFKEFNKYIEEDVYEIEKSPEMEIYFNEVFSQVIKDANVTYNDVKFTLEQLLLLFDIPTHNQTVITNPQNAIKLLNLNQTNNLNEALQLYQITSTTQLMFIVNYIFEYIPSIYLYPKFTHNEQTYKVNPLSKTFTSFIQFMITDSYNKLIANANLYHTVLAKLTYQFILEEVGEDNLNDVCPILLQRVLGQGKKVLQICSDPELSMNSYYAIKNWIKPYECVNDPTLVCDKSILYYLEHLAGLADEDIKKIYSEDSLGKYILQADNAAKAAYNCGDSCSDDNLSRLQFVSSYITRNPPKELHIEPCDTISEWDEEEFPMPIELFYFQKQLNCTEDNCNEQSNDVVLSLYNSTDNIFSNAKALKNKRDLEIVLTLLLNNVNTSEYSQAMNVSDASKFIGVFSDLLHTSLFNETIYQSYKVDSILYGNNDEDAGYLKLLSQGGFYDNFKPNMAHTTGFNIYLDKTAFTNDNELSEYDTYTIQTTQNDSDILRRITLINDVPILNIKKKEYTNVDNAYIDVNAPLYNFAKINDNSMWMSDGYQFPVDQDRIYYLDEMSSRVFEFNYTNQVEYGDISCRKYILNTYNLTQGLYEKDENQNYVHTTQRFNKPIVVSTVTEEPSEDENYFCVDAYSQMVVKANLTLLYSLHTGEYNYLNSKIEKDKVLPLLVYTRTYNVNATSYNEVFPEAKQSKTKKMIFVIIFIIIMAVSAPLTAYYWTKHSNYDNNLNDRAGRAGALLSESVDDKKSDVTGDTEKFLRMNDV